MAIVTKSGKIALSMVQAGDSQNFWMLPNDYSTSIPAGLYITKQSIDSFKASPSDSNIFMNSSSGIFIRNGLYNQIALQAGATDPSLRLYAPGGTGSEGELSVELTGGTNPVLKLHKIQGVTNTVAATLDTHGLVLSDGGIIAGTPNTSNFVYLSTNNYSSQNTPASGVSMTFENYDSPFPLTTDTNGEATVSFDDFAIQHESYYNGNVTIGNDSFSDINFADEVFDLDRNSPTATYVTDNGQYSIYASYNSSTTQITFHITAISTITINGNSSNWRLIAGTQFGVTNTGAIYGGDVHLTGQINATSGYIGGVTGWTITSNQLYNNTFGSNGSMYLSTTNLSGTIADTTITNGEADGTDTTVTTRGWRLTVGSNFGVTSLGQLYAKGAKINGNITATSLSTGNRTSSGTGTAGTYIDSSGNIYVGANNDFIIYANGSFYAKSGTISGSLTVDGTSNISGTLSAELQAAAQKATNFLSLATVDNVYGLKAASNVNSATSYAFIHAGGLKVYNGGTDVASFGATSRIGDEDGTHVFIDNGGLKFYHGDDFKGQLLYWGLDEGNLRLGVGDSAQYANITEYSVGTTESRIIMTAAGTINGYNSQMTIRINNDCIVIRGIANTFYTISGNANIAPVGTILDAHSHYVPSVQWGPYDPLTQSSYITAKVGDIYIKTS